jgi:TPR repeat protein
MAPKTVVKVKSKGEKIDSDIVLPSSSTGGTSDKDIARKAERAKAEAVPQALLWQYTPLGTKDRKRDRDPLLLDIPPMFWEGCSDEEVRTVQTQALEGVAVAQLSMGLMFTDESSEETMHELHPKKSKKETDLIGASWIQKAAVQGNAAAQVLLGDFYLQARGVLKNNERAFYWFMSAAEQYNPEGQYKVGQCYENGEGVIQSKVQAAEWYEKAALQGNMAAQTALGIMFCKGEKYTVKLSTELESNYAKMGFEALLQAAERDKNAKAQYWLGILFRNGRFGNPAYVDRDYKIAFEWLQKAAEQGDARAQAEFGVMYKRGRGVDENFVQAFEWTMKAALQGDLEAQCNLADDYLEGSGVQQSDQNAYEWLQKASALGSARAQYGISLLYKEGKAVQQSDFQAFEWCRKAAEQEYPQAQLALALMYAEGKGIEKDSYKALLCLGKVSITTQTYDFGEFNPTREAKNTLDRIQELDRGSRPCCIVM